MFWYLIFNISYVQNKLNTKDKEIQQREKVLKSKATKAENTELALLNSNKNEKPVRRLSFRYVMLNIFLFIKWIFFFNFYYSIFIIQLLLFNFYYSIFIIQFLLFNFYYSIFFTILNKFLNCFCNQSFYLFFKFIILNLFGC